LSDVSAKLDETPTRAPRLRDVPGALRSAAFIALFFLLGVFINSFTSLPLNFLLKERLHLDVRQLAWFGTMSDVAWYIKPAFGLMTDRLTLWGSRRRSYLFLMGSMLLVVWSGLALAPGYRYGPLLGAMTLSAMALAFMNTVTAGLLAELSRVSGASGRLNSLRQIATQTAILAAGPAGGWAAEYWSFQQVAGVAAGVAVVLLAGALLLVREPGASSGGDSPAARVASGASQGMPSVLEALRSRSIWLAFGFILLVEMAPGFNSPLLYYQTDVLHFPKKLFGQIQLAGAVAAILGAMLYARLCQRRSMRFTLPVILALHAVATLTWLGLATPTTALAIKAITGLTLALSNLVIFDLATRAAPRGVEGTTLALLFARVNLALRISDVIGSELYQRHWSLQALALLNAGTTLLAVLLVPLLPRTLIDRRDNEVAEAG
jgi:predicted MFS family arabinose efflux permease